LKHYKRPGEFKHTIEQACVMHEWKQNSLGKRKHVCQRTTCGTEQYVKSPIESRHKQTKVKQY